MLIYNPASGRQKFGKSLPRTESRFQENGYDLTVFPTEYPRQATEFAQKACLEKYDYLIIAGGDGTFNECLNGIMESEYRPIIGHLPAGTGCDIAHTLGISKNIDKALDLFFANEPVRMDVVKSNDRYFTYVSGNGAFIDISYVTESKMKKKFGWLAYLLKAFEELFTIPKMKMKATYDNGVVKGVFALILIINSKRVAGMNLIYKPILDDGMVDVVMYRSIYPFNWISYLGSYFFPFWSTPLINRFKTKELKIETNTTSRWNIDGESGGVGNQNIRVCRQAIQIVVSNKIKDKYFKHRNCY
jgi:diacylglycerol kinase (ATP)